MASKVLVIETKGSMGVRGGQSAVGGRGEGRSVDEEWRGLLGVRGLDHLVYCTSNWHTKNDFSAISQLHLPTNRTTALLQDAYPFQWNFFELCRVSPNYWSQKQNEKFYLEVISQRIPIRRQADWKKVDLLALRRMHGESLLKRTDTSTVLDILQANFPEFFWDRLAKFPPSEGPERRRVFMDQFIVKNFQQVEYHKDLASIENRHLLNFPKGRTLLSYNRNSTRRLFVGLYPEFLYQQVKWRRGDFNVSGDVLRVMRVYVMRNKEDWYKVSNEQVEKVWGKRVPKMLFVKLLKEVYPEEIWNVSKFSARANKKSVQRYLGLKLKEIFGKELYFEEYMWRSEELERNFVFDFYFPAMKMVIEYQGEHHYFSVLDFRSIEIQRKRDEAKLKACSACGLKLIFVPFWWDSTVENLKHIIFSQLDPSY